jgi:hypothetical protein
MKPSVVLLGFVLGSAGSIAFSLFGVLVVLLFLRADHPELEAEFPYLLATFGGFTALTVLAGASFYAQLREARWRRPVVGALLGALALIGWVYWPG